MEEKDRKILEKEARMKDRFRRKSSYTSVRYLRRMKELSGAPEEMMPFFDILDKVYTKMESPDIPKDIPMVGTSWTDHGISEECPTE